MFLSEGFDRDAAEARARDYVERYPLSSGYSASRVAHQSLLSLLRYLGVSDADVEWVVRLIVAGESEAMSEGFSRGFAAAREPRVSVSRDCDSCGYDVRDVSDRLPGEAVLCRHCFAEAILVEG